MLLRIQGLFIVVNTLLVPAIILGLGWLVIVQGAKFQAEWQKTKAPLVAIANKAEHSAEKIQDIAERTEAQISKAVAKIEKVGASLEKMGDTVSKPLNAIADFKIPTLKAEMTPLWIDVPGLIPAFSPGKFRPEFTTGSLDLGAKLVAPFQPIVTALADIAGPLGDLKNAVRELEKLKALQPQIAEFQRQVGIVANQVLALAKQLAEAAVWLAWLAAGLLVWFTIGYIFWAVMRLRRGCALIAGRG